MTRRGWLLPTLAFALPAAITLGWLLAGSFGAFTIVAIAFATLLLSLRLAVPPTHRTRRPSPGVPFPNQSFPAYRQMEETLMWATVSARHFDHAARPVLTRLAATQLAERRGIDLFAHPDRARAALGEQLWPLIDPARPVSTDTDAPGVPPSVLARFIDRLETL